jgi:hypothetical protein
MTTAESEQTWKREANRRLRRASIRVVKAVLHAGDPDELMLPVVDEVANQYDGPKDGKQRFNPRKYPDLMRK